MQNLILPATQTDQRTRPTAQPLLALLVCFTEMAFMFPAFHTVRSSGLAADGLGAMTGPVIPGAARQDKKRKEKQKRRLQTRGTCTARNVMRELHGLG